MENTSPENRDESKHLDNLNHEKDLLDPRFDRYKGFSDEGIQRRQDAESQPGHTADDTQSAKAEDEYAWLARDRSFSDEGSRPWASTEPEATPDEPHQANAARDQRDTDA